MNPHVRWVGTAKTPDQCVPCPVCHVPVGRPCLWASVPIAHQKRQDAAKNIGFEAIGIEECAP